MKNTLFLFLAGFYLMMASGINVRFHFCGERLKSISLITEANACCCGTKKKSKGCCQQKTAFLKVKDSHYSNFKRKVTPPPSIETPIREGHSVLLPAIVAGHSFPGLLYQGPPLRQEIPIYLEQEKFLI